jgi:hypothetical protein
VTEDQGRVVVVAAGFALWVGGRCVAAARWSDIKRLRAYHRAGATADAVRLGVDLLDGTVMELHEQAPGFDLFLDRAKVVLTGLLPVADWPSALADAADPATGVLLYEKRIR